MICGLETFLAFLTRLPTIFLSTGKIVANMLLNNILKEHIFVLKFKGKLLLVVCGVYGMVVNGPKQSGLRKHIICLLGETKDLPELSLKTELRKLYTGLPATNVDSAVDTLLLELEEKRIVQIETGDRIGLTEAGEIEYKSIIAVLEQKKKRRAQLDNDKLIKQALKQKKMVSKAFHEEVKNQLAKLAHLLGKTWKQEHELAQDGPVKLDIVWYPNPPDKISHAFEVQHRGNWKNAIGNLEAVKRWNPDCRLFLVVHDEKQITTIKRLLGIQLNNSIMIIRVSQVQDWLGVLGKISDDKRPRIIDAINSIYRFGLAN